ncbi:histone deacetylase family protein [Undibacterium sp.]|uniref:histone deacetylase family protein n=1 Tax=Undibacterium sp. TaxID=1914977 RepID=UPI0025DC27E8|nr:histone deacetylase family protein [Undibacterium sp.]
MTTAFYTHTDCQLHEMGAWHPEAPARLQAIADQLVRSQIHSALQHRQAAPAPESALALVHSAAAIARVRDNCPALNTFSEQGGTGESEYFMLDPDTKLNAHSWRAALAAAGAALAATDAVMAGEVANAFCSVRPPGHHATPAASMGFCMFNNVAIAAEYAMQVYGLQRVAIVDFDVHHGNGTEDAFAGDPRVLMVSFFQHPFYPYSGTAQPAGNMLNLPVPAHTQGDLVRQIVTQQWLPALHLHQPEMIFISAGFDAHKDDDMGQMDLIEDDYRWITQEMMQVAKTYAQGRIVSCLEGGYNLPALGLSVVAHLKALAELE